jgi:putative membrane protein
MGENEASATSTRFRDHSANERTFLAWIRTGIALMAFGFAIARFSLFLREIAQAGQLQVHAVRSLGSAWFGVVLVVLGLVTNGAALTRYVGVRKELERGGSIVPSPVLAYGLGMGSVIVAIAMAAMLATALHD